MDLARLAEPFPADDIEWRVGQSGQSGGRVWCKVLAYVTARAIMARLDEVCGPAGWTATYRHEGGGVMCELAIRVVRDDGLPDWVAKEDGSDATEFEPFKGGISGALKRAGAVWGIGRYLYKLPEGWGEVFDSKGPGRHYARTKEGTTFYWKPPELPAWALPGGEPAAKKKTARKKAKKKNADLITVNQRDTIDELRRDVRVTNEAYNKVILGDYGVTQTEDLSVQQAEDVIARLQKRRDAMVDQDAREAFGDDGSAVQKTREMARGFISTLKRHGSKYKDGTPIDYAKEGFPAASVEEVEALVDAMSDEQELKEMVVRLEALHGVIAF